MTLQLLLVLTLVLASALWFGRGFVRALLGRGGCASGGSCGSCRVGGCDVTRFEAIRVALERERAGGGPTQAPR